MKRYKVIIMKSMFKKKKADISYWLVRFIIALLFLFVLLMIVTKANQANLGFLDVLKKWF